MTTDDHAPDSPFGCHHQWGPHEPGHWPQGQQDQLRHGCNLASGHGGDCACKCGDTHAPIPGPPAPPRCLECGGHPRRPHTDGCSVGAANDAHWGNVRAVEKSLADAIAAKRADREFMARLRRNIDKHADLLERLADA